MDDYRDVDELSSLTQCRDESGPGLTRPGGWQTRSATPGWISNDRHHEMGQRAKPRPSNSSLLLARQRGIASQSRAKAPSALLDTVLRFPEHDLAPQELRQRIEDNSHHAEQHQCREDSRDIHVEVHL